MALNYEQEQAVNHQGHLAVLACPGSGKTFTIIHRAQRILNQPSSKLGMVTFTNAATDEMSERLGKVDTEKLIAGTFHRLAKMQQEMNGTKVNLISSGEKQTLAIRASQAIGEDTLDHRDVINRINEHKNNYDGSESELVSTYQSYLRQSNRQDVDDLILLAVEGMKAGTVEPLPFTHLLIDEFQDVNPLQLAWVKAHIDHGVEVTVVLDDDQSIYGFRQAVGIEGLKAFTGYTQAREIILSTCYRCHQEILDSAYALISHNSQRIEKQIHSHKGRGGIVELKTYHHDEDEADDIVQAVRKNPTSWAVLTPTNKQQDIIRSAFDRASVPYTTLNDSGSIWDHVSVSTYINLLHATLHMDTHGIEQALSWAGLSELYIRDIKGQIDESLRRDRRMPESLNKSRQYKTLCEQLNSWRSLIEQQHPVTNELVLYGIKDWMESHTNNDKEIRTITRLTEVFCTAAGRTLQQRLAYVERLTRIKDTKDILVSGVVISTIHTSKGLQWENVWMPFMNQGVIPHRSTMGERALAEQRRVTFVGMTRAIKRLVLSANASNMSEFLPLMNIGKEAPKPFMDMSVLNYESD